MSKSEGGESGGVMLAYLWLFMTAKLSGLLYTFQVTGINAAVRKFKC
jgi:hypothetical protein